MVSLHGTYENGVITLDEDSVVSSSPLKVIVTFLNKVEVKQPYKLVVDGDSDTILLEEPVAKLQVLNNGNSLSYDEVNSNKPLNDKFSKLYKHPIQSVKSSPKIEELKLSWKKSRELTKNYKGSFSDAVREERDEQN